MPTYEVGNTVYWGLTVKDATGALADVGTGPTAVVLLPDGVSTASVTVSRSTTGSYVGTYTATVPGRHTVRWYGSGANSGGLNPYTDVADVLETDPGLLISLGDAREALNLPAGTTASDDEIRFVVTSARRVLEMYTGPLLPVTKVDTLSGDGGTALHLRAYPNSITSVVEDGSTVTATAYAIGEGGVLWRRTGAWSDAYPSNIVVTYTAGPPNGIIPQNVLHAAREQVRFLWQIGQVAARPALGTNQAPGGGYVPMGYAVPRRVIELLAGAVGAYGPVSMP